MSLRSIAAVALLATSAWCAAPVAWAQDASIKQVYQAAEAGKFIEAQAMMDKVLRDHPNSGKAHFIEAELLAKQGKFAQAGTELANAERLAPGLPFAKPEAVQRLRALTAGAHRAPAARAATPPESFAAPAVQAAAPAENGIPWFWLLVVGGVVVAVVAMLRKRTAGQAMQQRYSQTAGAAGTPGMGAAYPQYANAGNAPFGAGAGAPGSGIGSGIMGGLATGAALGAGMVAGEALMHHFTDGNRNAGDAGGHRLAPNADPLATPDPLFSNDVPPSNYDMGGDDFGVSDPGSWDTGGGDGGGGGGDEWN